eukprot:Pgem_evm2s5513
MFWLLNIDKEKDVQKDSDEISMKFVHSTCNSHTTEDEDDLEIDEVIDDIVEDQVIINQSQNFGNGTPEKQSEPPAALTPPPEHSEIASKEIAKESEQQVEKSREITKSKKKEESENKNNENKAIGNGNSKTSLKNTQSFEIPSDIPDSKTDAKKQEEKERQRAKRREEEKRKKKEKEIEERVKIEKLCKGTVTDYFKVKRVIGKGGFGEVRRGVRKVTKVFINI